MRFKMPIAVAIIVFLLSAFTAGAGAAAKNCMDCHKKIISSKRVIHFALSQYARMEQGCVSCHTESHAKSKGVLSLAAPVPDLCYMCHDKANFSKKYIHAAAVGGNCLTCHNPHASDAPKLLIQPVREVCQNCHPDKTNGKHILAGYGFGDKHPVMGYLDPSRKGQELGCSSCHNPHSSGKKFLFPNDGPNSPANLCLLCHTKITVRS